MKVTYLVAALLLVACENNDSSGGDDHVIPGWEYKVLSEAELEGEMRRRVGDSYDEKLQQKPSYSLPSKEVPGTLEKVNPGWPSREDERQVYSEILNEHGKEGWELIYARPKSDIGRAHRGTYFEIPGELVFKRPLR